MDRLQKLQADAITRTHLAVGRARSTGGPIGPLSQIVASQAYGIVEKPSESLPFGLTTEERESIEADITARKPIGDTPAYRKFLQFIFPNGTPFNTTIQFPYFEDYVRAVILVENLSKLFGKKVRLPTKQEAIVSMQTHNHLTGSRIVDSTEVIESNGVGFAWLDYHSQEGIDYAWWRSHDSRGNSEAADPHENGYSVIPVFA